VDYNSLTGDKNTAGSLARWANYGLLDTDAIMEDAQALIYQTLRCREMMVIGAVVAVATGDVSKALPARFLDPINLRDSQGWRLKARDLRSVVNRRTYTAAGALIQSKPCFFATSATTLELDCGCDASSAGNYLLDYYGAPPLLSVGNPTNFLTNRYPHVLRTAAMAMSADFMSDDTKYQRYSQRLVAMIADLQANDDLSLRGAQMDPDYSEA
jgi:hypothetical protein